MILSKSFLTILSVVLVFALLPDQRPNLYVVPRFSSPSKEPFPLRERLARGGNASVEEFGLPSAEHHDTPPDRLQHARGSFRESVEKVRKVMRTCGLDGQRHQFLGVFARWRRRGGYLETRMHRAGR